jgi:hypothetical protein
LRANPSVAFVSVVGEYRSLKESLAETLHIRAKRNVEDAIFTKLFDAYHDLGHGNPILFIAIDEFGKFLEYAAQNNPEQELYFIQQLAEFVSNPQYNIVLITTVHQNFDGYAVSLSAQQRQEWTKVKGRFRELTFNEPIEQLLFLASKHLEKQERAFPASLLNTLSNLFLASKAYTFQSETLFEIAESLYPLDLFSVCTLTIALQKYGQNERSLFSFLESTDKTSIAQLREGHFYHLGKVYDYLYYNFHPFIYSRYNPDFLAWSSIQEAIDRIERTFEQNLHDYNNLVKAIGLLSISVAKGANLSHSFLVQYAEIALDIKNAGELIHDLEKKKIIRYRGYEQRYILFEGSDLDIESALHEAGNKVDEVRDVVTLLKKYYELPVVIAKKASYESGTPRLFEYRLSDAPISEVPQGEIDGFINLVFNERNELDKIKQHSAQNPEAVLYGYFKNTKSIKDILFEIEKIHKVIEENEEDKVAVSELRNSILHLKNVLNRKIQYCFENPDVIWFFKGEHIPIGRKQIFNNTLSDICKQVYTDTPVFKNELVNRHKISASIHTAKRNYYKALIESWNQPHLGFSKDKFPPEKTIYLSLIEDNNIRFSTESQKITNSFKALWKESEVFLNDTKVSKRKVSELHQILSKRPFKMKQGFVDFWIPTFLFIKRDDFALFGENGYIPIITVEALELVTKYPSKYEIKAFDVEGVKLDIFRSYRALTQQSPDTKAGSQSFVETIRPFLRFYKDLNEYAKNTINISSDAVAVRVAIASSKDPEKTFFEDFPSALGYSIGQMQRSNDDLIAYTEKLQAAIRDLRTCYDALLSRVESFIQIELVGEEVPFEVYKAKLQARFTKLKRHSLRPEQRTFMMRLDSALEDSQTWLNSLAQSLIGKTLEKFNDQDEVILYDKFQAMIRNLDTLTELSQADIVDDEEQVLGLQISTMNEGVHHKTIRIPKTKQVQISKIEAKLQKQLSADTTLNIAALTNLLNQLLQE